MTNTYLDIAAQILKSERRPLTPRAILAEAYKSGIVPSNLHGKAQHKTLQARISEDIIAKRDRSRFFRTSPGKYFLRDFLNDPGIPDEFRRPFHSRRRLRELMPGPVLAIMADRIPGLANDTLALAPSTVIKLLVHGVYSYINPRKGHEDYFVIRPFVCVFKGSKILTYRVGRYRDDRESFLAKRSIGFSTLVSTHDRTLFNSKDAGIVDAGVRAAVIDLDLLGGRDDFEHVAREAVLHQFLLTRNGPGAGDMLAVVALQCPAWFEPFRRRLALNDLRWMDVRSRVNDLEDFDPWSKCILDAFYRKTGVFGRKLDG